MYTHTVNRAVKLCYIQGAAALENRRDRSKLRLYYVLKDVSWLTVCFIDNQNLWTSICPKKRIPLTLWSINHIFLAFKRITRIWSDVDRHESVQRLRILPKRSRRYPFRLFQLPHQLCHQKPPPIWAKSQSSLIFEHECCRGLTTYRYDKLILITISKLWSICLVDIHIWLNTYLFDEG